MPDLPYDWESQLDETVNVSDPAWKDIFGAHDVGLCAGPSQAQEPISFERPNFEYEPEWNIDNSFNPAPDVGSSDPGLSSSLDVNFGFNSVLDHGSRNPSFPFIDQPHTTGNILLANNINLLPAPGGLIDFELPTPLRPSYSPSVTFDALLSNVPSLGSIPTRPTSPSLLSQADTQNPCRLPLPPGGISRFECSVCGSTFALRAQLRCVS